MKKGFEMNKLYMVDDGERLMPVVNVRPCGESGRYVECDHAFEVGLRMIVRIEEVRDTSEQEVQKYKWVVDDLKKKEKGMVVTAKLKSLKEASYVDPNTGKVQHGYSFNVENGGWKYSDVTGPMLRELLEKYDVKQHELAAKCGIIPKNFRNRYIATDNKITQKMWERIESKLAEIVGCDIKAIRSGLRAISGKGV